MRKKAEKVECEVIDSKDYLALKTEYSQVNSIIDNIKGLLGDTIQNYLKIGYLLSCVDDNLLKKMGYENIYDFSKENFDLGVTSTKNFINVYKRFAIIDSDEENVDCATFYVHRIALKEEYNDYSLSQLVELLPVADSDLDKYNPDMTTKEIRLIKKQSQLTDYEQNFYALVEKRFKEIWSLVKLDDDIKTVFNEDTKLIFDNSGMYNFNLVYEKERNTVSVNTNINQFNFWIRIESPTYNHDYEYLSERQMGFIALNEEIDCKAIADMISNFINCDCKKFIEKMKRLKFESSEFKKVNSDLDKLIKDIEEYSKNKTFSLFDFKLGLFFDLFELLKKVECDTSFGFNKYLDELTELDHRYRYSVLSCNRFRIDSISRFGMTVSCLDGDFNLYLVIRVTTYGLFIKYEYRDDCNIESFTLNDAFELYPLRIEEYFNLYPGSCSLFTIYSNFAKVWVQTMKAESKKEE